MAKGFFGTDIYCIQKFVTTGIGLFIGCMYSCLIYILIHQFCHLTWRYV
ncbi:hypothetical protein HanPI659440_Chr09g0319511 [Helianthus annuus]|nr:hypothetical protein HanPI659440_Chr09g0319511 [Helianthus annuus]